jgi:hypothetical protein
MTGQTSNDCFNRFRRASQIINSLLDNPPEQLMRLGESSGCLDELQTLIEEIRIFLDDDDYLDDLSWNVNAGSR